MIFAYKLFTEQIGMNKEDLFTLSQSAVRGHDHRVIKKKATKLCRINAFSNRIIDDWNDLPKDVISTASTNSFKSSLDKHWKDEMFVTPF